MGLFDTVWVKCPTCGEENGFQSKSGECILGNYSLDNCPYDVLFDINRHAPIECECGTQYEIDIKSKTIVITKPPTMNQTDKPTGVPEDVQLKIDNLLNLNQEPLYREGLMDCKDLFLPELTAKEEEIKRLNGLFDGIKQRERVFFLDEVRQLIFRVDREEISISRLVEILNEKALGLDRANIYNMADTIKSFQEENAKLKEEVERLKKDVIDVLSENHQAQIAGYYNDDKTDAEREKRNAVIEEYSDLLIIFKARFNSPTTKK